MAIIETDGFLLTRQWSDTSSGIQLNFWFYSTHTPIHVVITGQQAICFIRQNSPLKIASAQRKPLKLKALDHHTVDGLYFSQQKDLNQLREHLSHDKQHLLESEIKPTERYLMERFVTAGVQIKGEAIDKRGYVEIHNPKIKPADINPTLRWLSLDIETEDLRGKLYSIAVTTASSEQVFMAKAPLEQSRRNDIQWCTTQKNTLQTCFEWINQYDPDVLVGWNITAFDLDFIAWKCRQLGIAFNLGRGQQKATLLKVNNDQMVIARIPGRVVLDGIQCLRSAFWSFESFALDDIANALLNKRKLIQKSSPEAKLAAIRDQYYNDPVALADYNLEDCRLVAEIFEKADLFNFSIQRSQITGLAMDRVGGSSAAFDHLYLPTLHRHGYVASDIGSQQNQKESPGGFVMDSLPGLYNNVLVLDFKSLYPSIIRTFKIDPLGLALGEREAKPIEGFLGAKFSRHTYLLPTLVTQLWEQRDQAKQDNNQPLSQAIKVIMNSFYGVLGSSGCRFFDPQLASSITMRGHEIIQQTKVLIEKQGYQVIYGDTDSVFVWLGNEVNEVQCESIGKSLQQVLNQWWDNHCKSEFNLQSHLEIEFETHYLRFLMPTLRGTNEGSKKRYAGMVNKKGKPVMVYKGLETVRSDWTPLARQFQQGLYERIFHNQPYEDYIKETEKQLLSGKLDDLLYYTKRLRRPLESYTKSQPPQVKAARKMNNPGRKITYFISLNGAEPRYGALEPSSTPIDYQHYIDKQLAPVADSILYFLDSTYEQITQRQLNIF